MQHPLLILGLLTSGAATAADSQPVDGLWAEISLAQISTAQGLTLGAVSAAPADQGQAWEAPLLMQGEVVGFTRIALLPSIELAQQSYSWQQQWETSMVQHPLKLPALGEKIQAVGDGAQYILLRSHNAVISVRDRQGHADQLAAALLSALID